MCSLVIIFVHPVGHTFESKFVNFVASLCCLRLFDGKMPTSQCSCLSHCLFSYGFVFDSHYFLVDLFRSCWLSGKTALLLQQKKKLNPLNLPLFTPQSQCWPSHRWSCRTLVHVFPAGLVSGSLLFLCGFNSACFCFFLWLLLLDACVTALPLPLKLRREEASYCFRANTRCQRFCTRVEQ